MLDVARHAQVQFSLGLLALLVCLTALAWRNVFGRPPAPDLVIPAWLKDRLWPSRDVDSKWRARGRLLLDGGLAALALVLALFAMTAGRVDGSRLDRERVFHEVIQAKYHAELGWDRIYACSWAADHDGERAFSWIEKARALELGPAPTLQARPKPETKLEFDERREGKLRKVTVRPEVPVEVERPPANVGGKLVPTRALADQAECEPRFADGRWDEFKADVATAAAMWPKDGYEGRNKDARSFKLAPVFESYGSTATPARLARLRLWFSILPVSGGSLFVLSLLGGLLSIGALGLVWRAYGLRAAALVGIVCFAELAVSPIASGAGVAASLALATVLAGFAAAELDRWALAGGLLAFASVELVWPSLVVLALVAKLGADWLAGHPRKRELTRLAIGAGATAVALLLLSATLPGGFGNWSAWADRVAVHRYADGSRQVGLRWLFVPDGSWLGGNKALAYPEKAQRLADRHAWILLCGVLLLVPSLLAVRRLPPLAFAGIAGVTATFAMFSTEATAWGIALPMLALAAAAIAKHHKPSALLVGRPSTVLIAGCLALCVGMHGIFRIQPFEPWLFNMVYSHLLTTLMLGLGVALLLLPGLREHGDPPGAPASIPVLLATSGRTPKPAADASEALTPEQVAAAAAFDAASAITAVIKDEPEPARDEQPGGAS
ncbi:hypothetical protein DB30_02791 [Enhygromyxa salina]|uniref:Uncharacterized protein n=1 Tax=Enhygromyxa salina TaxID=215803 RepID=A0A0C2A314_9BACT|nr:hypothetical protein [Enhygromyxa salina]KIG17758.1 hypothetical protein DB30_02791 [Enhygromyxa salina]